MYNERNRSADFMKGDRTDVHERQVLRMLEEIRAELRALRTQQKEEP